MGSSKVRTPEMSAEGRQAQANANRLLEEQRAAAAEQLSVETLLAPLIYESAGLTPIMRDGRIEGFERRADPMAASRQQIEQQLLDRSLAALSGHLPVDPALERGLAEERTTLQESLARQ